MSKLPFRRGYAGSRSMIDYISHQNHSGDPLIRRKMINQRLRDAKVLHSKDLYAHYGCVNAIEFSNDGEFLISGGDDKRVLLWNINKALSGNCIPKTMKGEHRSNIFCLSFGAKHTKIFSAGNDEQVLLHDVETDEKPDAFLHNEAVYGLSVDPIDTNLFASACDDGRILIWDIRSSIDAFTLASYGTAFHAVAYNPTEPRLLATANAKEGVGLWDIRKPRTCLMKYGTNFQGAMSVCFNRLGTQILALRRRLAPVLYELSSTHPAVQFDYTGYYNSCTMKSCCFAGENDQYVLSGSDNFKLYMWKVPDDVYTKKSQRQNKAHLVLCGHRSIVNQVRYNSSFGILASSGVEKIIKLWSTFPINDRLKSNYMADIDGMRQVYSHEEYIRLVLESGQFMTHDYSHHSVQEDPRMMAFFDSLVQRDIEGWTSDSSETSASADNFNLCFEVQSAGSETTSNSSAASSSDEEERKVKKDCVNPINQIHSDSDMGRPLPNSGGLASGLPRIDLRESFTVDRISQLIARKKQEQNTRSSKSAKEHKKRGKKLRVRHKKLSVKTFGRNEDPNFESTRRIINSVLMGLKVNDKRKLLQKKRARLMRLSRVSDHSSDSDGTNDMSDQFPIIVDVEIEPSLENNAISLQNGINHEDDTTRINATNVSNGVVEYIESLENVEESPETPSVPQSSTNGPNGGSSSAITLDSNGSLFLQPKTGKRHARNYRKRSAEDVDEDS